MRIAYDVGGVLSKYPEPFQKIIASLHHAGHDLYVITDMHKKDEVLKMLKDNGFGYIPEANVYCADYQTHGEMCKALLLRDLKIDLFFDDFVGYLSWDSSFGPAPIRCLIMPDGFRPYWATEWKTDDKSDFGRRVYKSQKEEN